MVDELVQRFLKKDRLALARLLSLAAQGQPVAVNAVQLSSSPSTSKVVAITGSGGVG
jgi:putative protein kinase ArgK-like GTPase of G3E family